MQLVNFIRYKLNKITTMNYDKWNKSSLAHGDITIWIWWFLQLVNKLERGHSNSSIKASKYPESKTGIVKNVTIQKLYDKTDDKMKITKKTGRETWNRQTSNCLILDIRKIWRKYLLPECGSFVGTFSVIASCSP